MASLDFSTSADEPAQVMLGFEGRNYLLCTLKKPDLLQQALDLNFEVGDEISLAANGKCHVHLTGYLIEDPNELIEEEEGDDELEDEEIEEEQVKTKSKKRNKDIKNGPPVKKAKQSSTDDDDNEENDSDSDVDVKALLENTLESDEEDETFVSEPEEVEEEESDDGEVGEEEEDGDDDDDAEEEQEEEEDESSLSDEETTQNSKPKLNGMPKKELQTPSKQKDKKNKNNEQKQQQNKTPNKENQLPKGKDSKKTLQNGLIIEEIKEGQSKPAKAGNFVTVYYEGRLKSNNKVFDATRQGAGFSFRLGGNEVIKGWDVGLVGMKVGGKRRITCPPNMAYGAKGSPPAIPANSTLVFEVELRKIR